MKLDLLGEDDDANLICVHKNGETRILVSDHNSLYAHIMTSSLTSVTYISHVMVLGIQRNHCTGASGARGLPYISLCLV